MTDLAISATSLLRATARARSLKDATLVIKLGGAAMEDPAATSGMLDAVAALHQLGMKLVLVHGGGKPIDRAMEAAGLTPKKVQGRRYTDQATLDIVVKVLCDEINAGLVHGLHSRGINALWMPCGAIQPMWGEKLILKDEHGEPIDLGFVGTPSRVEVKPLMNLLQNSTIPVIPSLIGPGGGWLNVNADTAASAIAGALQSEAVYFLTDTPGVLANKNDPTSHFSRLRVVECRTFIANGTIDGGMIPKVEACFEALAAGAKRAVILDGRNPHSLLSEFVSDRILGTEIVP